MNEWTKTVQRLYDGDLLFDGERNMSIGGPYINVT